MVKYPRRSSIQTRGANLFFALLLLGGCASSARMGFKNDPFSDPSKFESLASNAYASPVVATAEKPLEKFTAPAVAAPLTAGIDGNSLVSAAVSSIEVDLATRAPAAVVAVPEEGSQTPDTAYSNLIRGNERFVTGAVKGEHRDEARRRSLAGKQNPHSIILSCSDSRVPPELIFDQGLGDLFTIRVAGNILGSAQVASLEYAVEHLGAKLIVTMGHESCGAVKAAIHSKPKISSGSTDLDWLVSAIRPNLAGRGLASASSVAADPKLRQPVMANVDAVTEQLLIRSKIISHAIHAGKLKIVRGIYSLDSGRVDFWGLK